MKIVICGSMSAAKEMIRVSKELMKNGFDVMLPENIDLYVSDEMVHKRAQRSQSELANDKIKNDFIRKHYKKIQLSDIVLIVNADKGLQKNYIGANAFLEAGFAYILHKPLYILNEIPETIFKDELTAMQPIVLYGDISKIPN